RDRLAVLLHPAADGRLDDGLSERANLDRGHSVEPVRMGYDCGHAPRRRPTLHGPAGLAPAQYNRQVRRSEHSPSPPTAASIASNIATICPSPRSAARATSACASRPARSTTSTSSSSA